MHLWFVEDIFRQTTQSKDELYQNTHSLLKSVVSSLLQDIYQMKCVGCVTLVWGTKVNFLVLANRKVNAFAKQTWWKTYKVMIRKNIIHLKRQKQTTYSLLKQSTTGYLSTR